MRSKRKITILTFTVLVVFLVSFSCVSAATYSYNGSFDFTCGSKCSNTLNGETNGVYRKFVNGTVKFTSTDKASSSGCPGSGNYDVALYHAGFWSDTKIDDKVIAYSVGTTHSPVSYKIKDGGGAKYFLVFSGDTAYSYYAGDYSLSE